MTPSTSILCNGGYQFGRRLYHDWKAGGHGSVDLRHALVHSCDVYFYTVGQRMGIETMASFAHQFGLGEETGIELPSERVGIVPSTAWKQKAKNQAWLPGETISASIGQGYVNVTPLQMASLIGTVANDGVTFRPRLVQAVMDRATGERAASACGSQTHAEAEAWDLTPDQRGVSRGGERGNGHAGEVGAGDDRRENRYGSDDGFALRSGERYSKEVPRSCLVCRFRSG